MGDPKDLHVCEKVCFKKVAKIMESFLNLRPRRQDVPHVPVIINSFFLKQTISCWVFAAWHGQAPWEIHEVPGCFRAPAMN